jgi:Na+-transporting NADH:ubiquinone oxidoreductase subunit NqrB
MKKRIIIFTSVVLSYLTIQTSFLPDLVQANVIREISSLVATIMINLLAIFVAILVVVKGIGDKENISLSANQLITTIGSMFICAVASTATYIGTTISSSLVQHKLFLLTILGLFSFSILCLFDVLFIEAKADKVVKHSHPPYNTK